MCTMCAESHAAISGLRLTGRHLTATTLFRASNISFLLAGPLMIVQCCYTRAERSCPLRRACSISCSLTSGARMPSQSVQGFLSTLAFASGDSSENSNSSNSAMNSTSGNRVAVLRSRASNVARSPSRTHIPICSAASYKPDFTLLLYRSLQE